jgi:hypothetical protein
MRYPPTCTPLSMGPSAIAMPPLSDAQKILFCSNDGRDELARRTP